MLRIAAKNLVSDKGMSIQTNVVEAGAEVHDPELDEPITLLRFVTY